MSVSRIGRIYRVSGRKLGIGGAHDVVVVGESTKGGTVRVKTVTSLEHEGRNRQMYYDLSALGQAKRGELIPIPISAIGSRHWSAIHTKGIVVREADLTRRKACSRRKVPARWLRVIR